MAQTQTCSDGSGISSYYGGVAGADYYQQCLEGPAFVDYEAGEVGEPTVLPAGFDPAVAGAAFAASYVVVATCFAIGYAARALLKVLK